jgi:dihydrofolate synthase
MDLQLHRISRLVRDYHAVLPWKAVHIAGTNGKGTTSAFLSALLHARGFNVGRFNSPHLKYRHDSIVVNERPVEEKLFLQTESLIKKRDAKAKLGATSFELLTATAFELFAQQKVDIAVVECGLGGRLDATNILLPREVLCSVITRISLDHQELLGDSVLKIASEKAGIIKEGVPVVADRYNDAAVLSVLKATAASCGSSFLESTALQDSPMDLLDPDDLGHGISSSHALAIATKVLDNLPSEAPFQTSPLSKSELQQAISTVQSTWKGRLQWEDLGSLGLGGKQERWCLIDGAHNRQGALQLRAYVNELIADKPRPVLWLLAMSSGKNPNEIMAELVQPGDSVAVCEFGSVDGMPWVQPHPLKNLLEIASQRSTQPVTARSQPVEALQQAFASATPDTLVVVCGSLYLIGQLLRELDESQAAR